MQHIIIPINVGIIKAKAVHFKLPVSFLIVKHVVPHGKCIKENIITQIAVVAVQPFDTNSDFSAKSESDSNILPAHM